MEKNYTPINLKNFSKKENSSYITYLLILANITALILVILLFLLIKKQMMIDKKNLIPFLPFFNS